MLFVSFPQQKTVRLTAKAVTLCISTAVALCLGGCSSTRNGAAKNEAQTRYEIGLSFYTDGRFPESIEQLARAYQLDGSRPEILMHLGLAHLRIEKYKEAEDYIRQACEQGKEFAECWNNLAFVRYKRKEYRAGMEAARKALSYVTYTTPELAHGNLALSALELREYKQAHDSLQTALRLNPQFCQARVLVVKVFVRKGDFERALSEAKQATNICPEVEQAHLWQAFTYYKMGSHSSARIKCEQTLERFRKGVAVDTCRSWLEKMELRKALDEPTL